MGESKASQTCGGSCPGTGTIALVALLSLAMPVEVVRSDVSDERMVTEKPLLPKLERERERDRQRRSAQTVRPSRDTCRTFYDALRGSGGDELVRLIQSAEYGCVAELEWVDDARLQRAVATEGNVVDVAGALPEIVDEYDGSYDSVRLRNLLRFLVAVQDIHLFCVQQGASAGGTCADPLWESVEPWDTAPGSSVHGAIAGAIDAIRLNPHFGDANPEHGDTLIEVASAVRYYAQSADHLELARWWLTRWDDRHRAEHFVKVMHAMFDVLHTGHRNGERFGPVFGEDGELLDTLLDRALQRGLVGTDWQFIATRSAIEIGRFSLYPETSNYVRVREAVRTIRTAYGNDAALRPVWLRVVAELDYNDSANCAHYGTCDWYGGDGFNANFRKEVFARTHECPTSHCPDDRVTIHAQNLSGSQLALACERLDDVNSAFHRLFDTNCEPVEGDFNNHLDAYVFHDIDSCEDYSSAAFFRNADTCSGIYYERDPADRSTRPYFVANEYEPWENPPDPRLSIWNWEHEYAHYLDGRYNLYDGYRGDLDSLHWWIEGVAEYLAAQVSPYLHAPPFESPHTLVEILLHSDSLPTRYRYRHLAVRFFMENHRDFVDTIVGHLRRGEYDAYEAFLELAVGRYSDAWETWLRSGGATVTPVEDVDGARDFVVPLFPAGGLEARHGFLRLLDLGGSGGPVLIAGTDDGGVPGTASTLRLAPGGGAHFNSADLEGGNAAKGLTPGTGAPTRGDWRLRATGTDVGALAYVRTHDGLVTPLVGTVPAEADGGLFVAFFNPASNWRQRSLLRLANRGEEPAAVTVEGIDDAGAPGASPMRLTLQGGTARALSARDLERGASGLEGRLGDGTGKWRLTVSSDRPVEAMSLLESPSGHLANLSAATAARTALGDGNARTLVPMLPAADDPDGRQGFLRVVNRGAEAAEVRIEARDDAGQAYPALTLTVGAGQAVHVNSDDLELGAAAKGLPLGTGPGEGGWRLVLTAPADVWASAYLRYLDDGFVTGMNALAPVVDGAHRVDFLNPASNWRQASLLRLINDGEGPAKVTVTGTDDAGEPGAGPVALTLTPHAVRTLTAAELESGGEGLQGALGDGAGKWRLRVSADGPIRVMSLLASPTGHLANLSAGADGPR